MPCLARRRNTPLEGYGRSAYDAVAGVDCWGAGDTVSRSARLCLSDIQGVFRLLGEVRALGRAPDAWRRHALAGLMELTGACAGVAGLEAVQVRGVAADFAERVEVGLDSAGQQRVLAEFVAGGHIRRHPGFSYLRRTAGRPFTRTRSEMIADAAWYGSAVVADFHQALGCDDFLHSRRGLAGFGACDALILHRAWGAGRFDGRARAIVRLFHDELARLWSAPATGRPWPPHLRRLVGEFQCGRSEKEAAVMLGLSRHTVHSYAKELYRRLGVKSRGEALATLAWTEAFVPRPSAAPAGAVNTGPA